MCGLTGWVGGFDLDSDDLRRMTGAVAHRGPDDEGLLHVPGKVGIGFRRLAVIDLDTGNQPLRNEDGTCTVTCNGEVYNFRELRRDLQARGHAFVTRSDAETIVHLYEERGPDCLHGLDGMFAIALWDASRERLMLAVDRLGVKPLYWAAVGQGIVYGSEPAAILASGLIAARPDPVALMQYLTLQYVPAPLTAFLGIHKLGQGERLLFDRAGVRVERWWALPELDEEELTTDDALEQADDLLREAVRRRLASDVPLGAFLSGGVDSSLVVSYLAEATTGPVRTFSVDVPVPGFSEGEHARTIAALYGTEHHELIVDADSAAEIAETAVLAAGEPFADWSAIPTYLLARDARRHVTVVLTGDAGDEAFGGYERYAWAADRDRLDPAAPVGVRSDTYARMLAHFYPEELERLCRPEFVDAAGGTRTAWDEVLVLPAGPGVGPHARLDTTTYLPGDLLVKVDRMTMAHALEARGPFLDHRLHRFSARLPSTLKLRDGTPKWLLRRLALRRGLPTSVVERPKMGFTIPVACWLRGPMREWVTELVVGERARARGYFEHADAARRLTEHLDGEADHANELWNLAVLELWHRRWIDSTTRNG